MKFPRNEELMEIAQKFNDMGFLDGNVTVIIEVDDKKTLNRINDDFFYRYKDEKMEKVDDVSVVNVNIGGIRFMYIPRQVEESEKTEDENNKQ